MFLCHLSKHGGTDTTKRLWSKFLSIKSTASINIINEWEWLISWKFDIIMTRIIWCVWKMLEMACPAYSVWRQIQSYRLSMIIPSFLCLEKFAVPPPPFPFLCNEWTYAYIVLSASFLHQSSTMSFAVSTLIGRELQWLNFSIQELSHILHINFSGKFVDIIKLVTIDPEHDGGILYPFQGII